MGYPGVSLVATGLVVWLASVLLTVLFLLEPLDPIAGCDLVPGRYIVGEPDRSWFPPGLNCTYTGRELRGLGDTQYVVEPSPLRLVVVGLAFSLLPVCLRLHQLLRRAA